MLVPEFRPRADDVGRPGQGGELAATGHVVVVEVRLDDADDAQVLRAGGLEIEVDVPSRVDHGGDAGVVIDDEGRQVAEATDRELLDTHRGGA